MSIQSLNGYVGNHAAPSTPPRTPAPATEAVVAQPAQPVQPSAPSKSQQVEQALERLKSALPSKANALQFSVDEQSGDTIVRVVDSATGDVIRQIPSKELVEIAHAIDKMQGMLIKQSA